MSAICISLVDVKTEEVIGSVPFILQEGDWVEVGGQRWAAIYGRRRVVLTEVEGVWRESIKVERIRATRFVSPDEGAGVRVAVLETRRQIHSLLIGLFSKNLVVNHEGSVVCAHGVEERSTCLLIEDHRCNLFSGDFLAVVRTGEIMRISAASISGKALTVLRHCAAIGSEIITGDKLDIYRSNPAIGVYRMEWRQVDTL